MIELLLASDDGPRLRLLVHGRSFPHAQNEYDRDWLDVEGELHADGFSGVVRSSLLAVEVERFAAQLSELQATLDGAAVLHALEPWITLSLTGDGLGHVDVDVLLGDPSRQRSRLAVSFRTDQTFTAPFTSAWREAARRWPRTVA